MPTDQQDHLRALAHALAPHQLFVDPVTLSTYQVDAGLAQGRPEAVAFPEHVDDLERIVQWANEHHVPLVARGAGTGLSGGAVPHRGGVIVEFARMNRVLELDPAGRSAVVQPGMVNQSLDEFVKTRGLYFPADPASGRSCTLGGNIGENAGGPHCFKYGVTTNYITGLTVVLADGRPVHLGGRAFDYPEYDLVGLVTGGEGTLGLIAQADVRLLRNPPAVKTMMAVFDSVEAAGQAVSALIARGLVPATMEMMDQKIIQIVEDYTHAGLPTDAGALVIVETDGYPASLPLQAEEITAILNECQAREVRSAQTAAERDKIWFARKSAIGALARLAPAYLLVDGTVPRSRLAQTLAGVNQICDEHHLRVGYVFHAGDGNLHPLILIEDPNDPATLKRVHAAGGRILALCVEQGGTITGEHGVGIEKRQYMPLMYNADEVSAMQDVKEVFDPEYRLNPDKILPAPRSAPLRVRPAPRRGSRIQDASQAAEALYAWVSAGQSVRMHGGGTKSRGLASTDILLSTSKLRGIQRYSRDDLYVTVGAGTPLAELQAELEPDRMTVPLVSPWSASTVGGIVATNWNAPLRMRYGGVRDLVLAMTVALPDGRVIRAGRPVVKNVAGYDMPKLFVGSFGTLGLIADVTFKVLPLPRMRTSLVAPVDDLARGLDWGAQLLRICLTASALLLHRDEEGRAGLVYTAEGFAEDVAAELAQARETLKAHGATGMTLAGAPLGSDLWADWLAEASFADTVVRLGVPPKDLPGIVQAAGPALGPASFIADFASGLLYVRNPASLDALRQAARARGGYAIVLSAPPAERRALDPWGHTPDGLGLMRALKARWDPRGLLNPGAFIV